MEIVLDAHDPRGQKAVTLAAHTEQWQPVQAYRIPASTAPFSYLVTETSCTCRAYTTSKPRSECAHMLALRLARCAGRVS